MSNRLIISPANHAHFVTFSCYKRRKLLARDHCKKIVIGVLGSQLHKQDGKCIGFVIMPDHVHAIIWFGRDDQLSFFMKQWKQRSSVKIKKWFRETGSEYLGSTRIADPVWQRHYFSMNLIKGKKCREKLEYMHNNPVKAGLAASPEEWAFSSARVYLTNKPVGVTIAWPG